MRRVWWKSIRSKKRAKGGKEEPRHDEKGGGLMDDVEIFNGWKKCEVTPASTQRLNNKNHFPWRLQT